MTEGNGPSTKDLLFRKRQVFLEMRLNLTGPEATTLATLSLLKKAEIELQDFTIRNPLNRPFKALALEGIEERYRRISGRPVAKRAIEKIPESQRRVAGL